MKTEKARTVLVVGAGVMGSSIAQLFAMGDIDVTLVDVDEKALERAMVLVESGLNTMAEHGKIPRSSVPLVLARIHPSPGLDEKAAEADFVLEAVPEVPEMKRAVFSRLDRVCGKARVIASNTSGLDIFSIADVERPERLLIAHFFAPAHIIPLVEIVPGSETSREAILFTRELLEGLGKHPVLMKSFSPGFIVNRIQKAIGETALEMIEQGVAGPEEIDLAVKLSLGVRLPILGVVQTFDFQGLDMLLDTMKNYGRVYSFIEERVKQGRLGVKVSEGIYDYEGRGELEVLKKRDLLFLAMLDHLRKIRAFESF
ncbi:MAG: 3-hydroxyacyl-CoA dehydrogenase family protein [Deltaproteobacteria bacterium]|nr:3-hydroxyacyl-CoA dehydrogenase family protein [Deltaproteobacteria bacterium]